MIESGNIELTVTGLDLGAPLTTLRARILELADDIARPLAHAALS
jgi:hypothetical protein